MNCQLGDYNIHCNIDFTQSVVNSDVPSYITAINFYNSHNFNGDVRLPNWVKNCAGTFINCYKFNGYVNIPNNVVNCTGMYRNCYMFNHAVTIPDSVTNCAQMFEYCYNLDLPVTIGNNVTDCSGMFFSCNNFTNRHMPLILPDSVTRCYQMLSGCNNFTSNIYIGKGVTNAHQLFFGDLAMNWFNSHVVFNGVVDDFSYCFANCKNFNKPFTFPEVGELCNCMDMFSGCSNFAQNINVPDGVTSARFMFSGCKFDGQTIRFGNNILEMFGCFQAKNNGTNFSYNHIIYDNGTVMEVLKGNYYPINIHIGYNCNCSYLISGGSQSTGTLFGGMNIYVNGVTGNNFYNALKGSWGLHSYYEVTNYGSDDVSSRLVDVGSGVYIHTDSYASALNIINGIRLTNLNSWIDNGGQLEYWLFRNVSTYYPNGQVNKTVNASVCTTVIYY